MKKTWRKDAGKKYVCSMVLILLLLAGCITAAAETSPEKAEVTEAAASGPGLAAPAAGSAGYQNGQKITLDANWRFADFSEIHTGNAVIYLATENRKNKVIGVNAGHGTQGGSAVRTWCHPDKSAKLTGGSTKAGSFKATAVSGGMTFRDGTAEKSVTLRQAQLLKELLLKNGYDVLMLRDGDDVQLDNVARTVICNNVADCHIALHWDGDGLGYDKGCFYMSVPDGLKYLDNVAAVWEKSEALGNCLIQGLQQNGLKIYSSGSMDLDLTQTSYSSVPSVDIELGNQCSDHSDEKLKKNAEGLAAGIDLFFDQQEKPAEGSSQAQQTEAEAKAE